MSRWFFDVLETVRGTKKDYLHLADYHYQPKELMNITDIFKIRARKPFSSDFPDPIAVMVFCLPLPDVRGRTQATNGFFHTPATRSERMKLVNKHIRYAARLIVDPRFQKLGLGSMLLEFSMKQQTIPLVETLSPIDFTNRMLEKVGFKRYLLPAPPRYKRFTDFLDSIGLIWSPMLLADTLNKRLNTLKDADLERAEKEITAFIKHFKHRGRMKPGIKRCKYLLSKLPYAQAYFLWHNPTPQNSSEKRGKHNYTISPSPRRNSV